MVDGCLTIDHGRITLNGAAVPGILKSQAIKGAVRFDTAEPDGHSGTVRTPLGWEDADVVLVVELISGAQTAPYTGSDTCYEKLARIDRIFKGSDNGGNPKVYDVVNPHITARGIDQVVFSGLQSMETDKDDVLEIHMNFVEHLPFIQTREARVASSDKAYAPSPAGQEAEPDPAIMVDIS